MGGLIAEYLVQSHILLMERVVLPEAERRMEALRVVCAPPDRERRRGQATRPWADVVALLTTRARAALRA